MRKRGSLRSFRDSPTRVTPSTAKTMVERVKIAVHQILEVTSEMDRLRSYPHSAAEVGSIPKPIKPKPASVRTASAALSVKINGKVRVAFLKICTIITRQCDAPTTSADSTNGSAFKRTVSAS